MIPNRRQIPSRKLAFAAGEILTQDLPRKYPVSGYDLVLDYTLTVASGSSSSSANATRLQDELLKSAKIIVNGGTVLHHFKGRDLVVQNTILGGSAPANDYLSGALDIATYTGSFHYHIPVAPMRADMTPNDPRAIRAGFASWAEVGMLPTWAFPDEGLELELEYGSVADLSDESGNRTETLAVDVSLIERYGRSESLTKAQEQPGAYVQVRRERRTYSVDVAADEFPLELPRGRRRGISRIWLYCSEDDGSGFVPSDAVVEKLAVIGDENIAIMRELPWSYIQAANKADYQQEANIPTGWALLDFADDRNLGQILGTGRFTDLAVVCKTATPGTSGNKIEMIVETLEAA